MYGSNVVIALYYSMGKRERHFAELSFNVLLFSITTNHVGAFIRLLTSAL